MIGNGPSAAVAVVAVFVLPSVAAITFPRTPAAGDAILLGRARRRLTVAAAATARRPAGGVVRPPAAAGVGGTTHRTMEPMEREEAAA